MLHRGTFAPVLLACRCSVNVVLIAVSYLLPTNTMGTSKYFQYDQGMLCICNAQYTVE